jgi:hypothetical protein
MNRWKRTPILLFCLQNPSVAIHEKPRIATKTRAGNGDVPVWGAHGTGK